MQDEVLLPRSHCPLISSPTEGDVRRRDCRELSGGCGLGERGKLLEI